MKMFVYLKALIGFDKSFKENSSEHTSATIKSRIEKYEETYKLLEEYDRKSIQDPELLADAGRLRKAIAELERNSGTRRANPSL